MPTALISKPAASATAIDVFWQYIKNRDKIRSKQAAWRAENKEKIAAYRRQWYAKNKDRVRSKQAA
jgi:hypothetical protein